MEGEEEREPWLPIVPDTILRSWDPPKDHLRESARREVASMPRALGPRH